MFPKKLSLVVFSVVFLSLSCSASDTQPIKLPAPAKKGAMSLEEAIMSRRSKREFKDQKLTIEQISQILYAAQGISDADGKKRTVPSAMAMYPLEVYAVCPDGVFHYIPKGHMMEKIKDGDFRNKLGGRPFNQAVSIVITGVFSRFSDRLKERARDFAFIEAGHCCQNVLLQAVALGLGAVPTANFSETDVTSILSLSSGCIPLYVIPIGVPK